MKDDPFTIARNPAVGDCRHGPRNISNDRATAIVRRQTGITERTDVRGVAPLQVERIERWRFQRARDDQRIRTLRSGGSIHAPNHSADEKTGKNQPKHHLQGHRSPNGLVFSHYGAIGHEIRKSFCAQPFAQRREELVAAEEWR